MILDPHKGQIRVSYPVFSERNRKTHQTVRPSVENVYRKDRSFSSSGVHRLLRSKEECGLLQDKRHLLWTHDTTYGDTAQSYRLSN